VKYNEGLFKFTFKIYYVIVVALQCSVNSIA